MRPITEWVKILEPLTPLQAAGRILDDLSANALRAPPGELDNQLANALIAWAMLTKGEDQ
jgi:hypothetical protein